MFDQLEVPLLPFLSASNSPSALLSIEALSAASEQDSPALLWQNDAWSTTLTATVSATRGLASLPGDDRIQQLARQLRSWVKLGQESRTDGAEVFEVDGTSFRATRLMDHRIVVLEVRESHTIAVREAREVPTSESAQEYVKSIAGTEMGDRIGKYPWETTSLGPISQWPAALRSMVATMLASPIRTYVCWGKDNIILYNDPYIKTAQTEHPRILGQAYHIAWHEIWENAPIVREMIGKAWAGETVSIDNHHLVIERNGILEECYFSYSFAPVKDENGVILGIANRSLETTIEVVAERRMTTVRTLVSKTSGERTIAGYCDQALQSMDGNPYDLPFVQFYTCHAVETSSDDKTVHRAGGSGAQQIAVELHSRGSLGISLADAPVKIHLTPKPTLTTPPTPYQPPSATFSSSTDEASTSPFAWPFDEACETRKPVIVSDIKFLTESVSPRGWGDPPKQAVVLPIWTESSALVPQAMIVFGLNPRNVYTELYQSFVEIVARHLSIGLLAVTNAEEDARRADELIALDEAKSRFWSNASHELRTPLTLILGPLQDVLSRKDKLPRDVQTTLELVSRNGDRLLAMVNKLLDFSSLESSRQRHVFRPIKLARFTRELSTLFRDAIERRGIALVVDCEEDSLNWESTYLNEDLYQHVFSNLVGNALKYTHQGTITIQLKASLEKVVLFVIDTGPGIPERELGLIFDRFHRVQDTASSTTGSGIGLSLTLEIVKTLGAHMNVTSEVGKGSTFSVTFRRGHGHFPSNQVEHEEKNFEALSPSASKLTKAEIKDASGHRSNLEARVTTPSTDSAESGAGGYFGPLDSLKVSGSTILLVDDSPDLRSYIGGLLRKTYKVVEASDGQAALEMAFKSPPSLIVTDVMMPRLSGEGLFAALRANPSTASIPVIFLSAQAGNEARALALEKGVDDYLVKPFQSRELLARVRTHLQLAKMRAELEDKVAAQTAVLLETVERRAQDAEENRRHLELFIDVAMHEVRNPLSGALQNATVLGQSIRKNLDRLDGLKRTKPELAVMFDEFSKDLSEDLVSVNDILLCTTHQSRIANDILNVSKLHMGLLSVVGVPFDFVSKMESAYRLFVSECRETNIDFTFEIDKSVHDLKASWVVADPDRLAQAAINFITNGLKFTSRKGTLVMSVSASSTPGEPTSSTLRLGQTDLEDLSAYKSPVWVSLSVRDSGKGLGPEEMKKLFMRFGQANPHTDQYGGSGLGLYISKKLIELHHGFVEVDSVPGKGSCFRFTIPVERASPPLSSVGGSPFVNQGVRSELRILVVEDNIINQRILKRQLENRQCVVTVAGNGQEALDILCDSEAPPDFDCVLMDILMPIMNGLTAVKELRGWEEKQTPPIHNNVIAVTGNARQGQIDEYMNSGFDDIAIKPFKFDRLLEQIEARVQR